MVFKKPSQRFINLAIGSLGRCWRLLVLFKLPAGCFFLCDKNSDSSKRRFVGNNSCQFWCFLVIVQNFQDSLNNRSKEKIRGRVHWRESYGNVSGPFPNRITNRKCEKHNLWGKYSRIKNIKRQHHEKN